MHRNTVPLKRENVISIDATRTMCILGSWLKPGGAVVAVNPKVGCFLVAQGRISKRLTKCSNTKLTKETSNNSIVWLITGSGAL